jgi:hypothetical protein
LRIRSLFSSSVIESNMIVSVNVLRRHDTPSLSEIFRLPSAQFKAE